MAWHAVDPALARGFGVEVLLSQIQLRCTHYC